MVHLRPLLWAVLLCAFGGVLPAAGQQVRAYLSTDSVTVGDRFTLSIVAEHPATMRATFPDAEADSLFGDLEVLNRRLVETPNAAQFDSVVYEVTTFALDTAFVPPLPVGFSADADTFARATEALMLEVGSLVPADAQGLRDLAPLATFPRAVWPWVVGGLLLAALVALLVWYLRKRRAEEPELEAAPPPPPVPPYEEARRRLGALKRQDLSREEAVKPYFVELSDTLRTYVARRARVPAMEQTTREVMRTLRSAPLPLPDEALHRLHRILRLADLAKFADARPTEPQARQALAEAEDTLRSIEDALRPPPATDTPTASPEAPDTTPASHA